MSRYISLAAWVVIFEAVSFGIGTLTQGDVDGWYASLAAPPMTPPNILFPIMWTILYALIAAAGWKMWQQRASDEGRFILTLFGLYMILNWSWTFIFFSAHELLTAFLWILLLNIVSLILIMKNWRPNRTASYLMIPPTLWTCFAAYLSGGYWWLN